MSDIVERLRHMAKREEWAWNKATSHSEVFREAVAEIERLRRDGVLAQMQLRDSTLADIRHDETMRRVNAEQATEIERLRRENEAFREAIRSGDGPHCEDVCLVECVGPCGVQEES